jgi:hypothetical protein
MVSLEVEAESLGQLPWIDCVPIGPIGRCRSVCVFAVGGCVADVAVV